jgi:hypothetical protein
LFYLGNLNKLIHQCIQKNINIGKKNDIGN